MVLIASDADIKKTLFYHNIARTRGGALWSQNFLALFDQIFGLTPVFGTVHVDKSFFVGNRTLGVLENLQIESFPGVATIEEQPFGGGAITNDQAGNLVVTNSVFRNNSTTDSDGGAIHNATSPIEFYGTLVPPAPIFYEGDLIVRDSIFIQNEVLGSGSGGAIANGGNQVNGRIIGASLVDLRDTTIGATALVGGSIFVGNRAVDYGGSIVNWNASELVSVQNEFLRNTAGESGAVAAVGRETNQGSLDIEDSRFVRNSATSG